MVCPGSMNRSHPTSTTPNSHVNPNVHIAEELNIGIVFFGSLLLESSVDGGGEHDAPCNEISKGLQYPPSGQLTQ